MLTVFFIAGLLDLYLIILLLCMSLLLKYCLSISKFIFKLQNINYLLSNTLVITLNIVLVFVLSIALAIVLPFVMVIVLASALAFTMVIAVFK